MSKMYALRNSVVLLCASVAISFSAGTAAAQMKVPVTLTAIDGTMSISGNLRAVEDGMYVLQTNLGEMRLPTAMVKCEGLACPVIEEVVPKFGIHGSRTVGTDLIPNLLRGFALAKGVQFELIPTDKPKERIVRLTNPDGSLLAEIDLRTYGSGSAFKALAGGVADIGLADRRMKDGDVPVLAAAGVPDLRETRQETVLGLDGLVVMVHPDNPVRHLTTEQLAGIYSGEIKNWSEVGGSDVPILVNTFGQKSGDRAIFIDRILTPNGRTETPTAVAHEAYKDAADGARNNLGGIAYASRVHSEGANVLSIRESCGLLTSPTNFRMKTEGYVLSRRLYMYTKPGAVHPVAQEFLDWTLTDEAQPYIVQTGFVDRALELMRLEDMGMQMVHTVVSEPDYDPNLYREMLGELRDAERLSVAFRFNLGSATLDAQAVRDLEELAQKVNAGQFPGKELYLVGFADSIGRFDQNRDLAYRRATAVQSYLNARLRGRGADAIKMTPLSYGELMPLLCNETADGRHANRRVEVWLRMKDAAPGIATVGGTFRKKG